MTNAFSDASTGDHEALAHSDAAAVPATTDIAAYLRAAVWNALPS